ncbi:hypothetical protein BDZ45DRAFT_607809, partial [Acephala macrosclerotiorum]
NGTLENEWSACPGCAVIDRSLEGIGMASTKQYEKCLEKYCWDGTVDDVEPGIMNLTLLLSPDVSYEEWNATSPL